jgi:hypothetical protein
LHYGITRKLDKINKDIGGFEPSYALLTFNIDSQKWINNNYPTAYSGYGLSTGFTLID